MSNAVRLPRKLAFEPLLLAPGMYNPDLRAKMHGKSGVYILRRLGRLRPDYVGESHTNRAWKTMLRHLQGIASFRARGEWAPCGCPAKYEVAWIPARGEKAMAIEARAIRRYRPIANIAEAARAVLKEVGF